MRSHLSLLFATLSLAACTAPEKTGSTTAALTPAGGHERVLPWGDALDAQERAGERYRVVGLVPAREEALARGPRAVAVGAHGDVLVLDEIHRRVVKLDSELATSKVVAANLPADVDDLAAGADGAFAVLGATTGAISVRGPEGDVVGDVQIPMPMRQSGDLDGIVMLPSRRVAVRSAMQETFTLGSPSAQLPLDVALGTKKEGAFSTASGDGLAFAGGALNVIDREGERATVRTRIAIGGDAGRIVGVSGNVACMRVEHVSQLPAPVSTIDVKREAVCADVTTGNVVFRESLLAPGLYVPRHELAFANGVLAHIRPENAGLRVTTWTIGGAK